MSKGCQLVKKHGTLLTARSSFARRCPVTSEKARIDEDHPRRRNAQGGIPPPTAAAAAAALCRTDDVRWPFSVEEILATPWTPWFALAWPVLLLLSLLQPLLMLLLLLMCTVLMLLLLLLLLELELLARS